MNYLYDGSGNRVAMQSIVNGTTTLTSYIGSVEEVQTSGSTTQTTTYYSVGGKRVAADVNGTFYYFGYDALGSQVAVLNATGSLVGTQLYSPYGGSRYTTGTLPTSIGFTGQRADSVTGLDYYMARYYDPTIGQFLSEDSVQGNAQGMDPYAYVGGNPESKTDPTGQRVVKCAPGEDCGGGGNSGGGGTIPNPPVSGCGPCHAPKGYQPPPSWGRGGTTKQVTKPAGPTPAQARAASDNFLWQMCMSSDACSSNYWKERASYAAQKTLADVMLGLSFADPQEVTYWEEQEQTLEREMETEQEVATAMQGVTCSFAAQTAVTTVHGKQEISKLHPGEKVWSYNPQTHKMEWQPILHVWVTHDDDLVNLTITPVISAQSGKEKTQQGEVIQTNQKHRFLTAEQGFLPIRSIVVGMHIVQANGSTGLVTNWQAKPGSQTMYNLEVAHNHTYVVGDQQWVVHNECWSLAKDEAMGGHTIGHNHVINEDGGNFDRVLERLSPPESLKEASAFYSLTDAEDAISYAITTGDITVKNNGNRLVFNATYTREVGFVATSKGGLEASNLVTVVMQKNSSGLWYVKTAYLENPNP